ncbi:VlmB-like protein [Streptomyces polygonati]|uniref:VlmB-like protein n=1 Tax=Streptomyces polygonati TaxID=1617087 RepID=A0ABV8HJ35_9ACTN
MTETIPSETDWDQAPGLLDGAMTLVLTPEQCDLPYWLTGVAQGTLADRARSGHTADETTPEYMREPGPLRDALVLEMAHRSVAEDQATRALAYYVANAPAVPEMEFYSTQLIDEARHSMVFRNHLLELGVSQDELHSTVEALSVDYKREVIDPILEFAVRTVRDENDFVGGVAVFTIVIEGVLAPAAELSERKWNVLDPAAGAIARGASIDEIRHLAVGSAIVREHLIKHPEYRPRLMDILERGRRLWDRIPDRGFVIHREKLFQQGMRDHSELLASYEVWPGRLLLDTTPDERYDTAEHWTDEMAVVRMKYMGIENSAMHTAKTPAGGDHAR